MRDLRDPISLGNALLNFPQDVRLGASLSETYDKHRVKFGRVRKYDANPSTIEKYGRPQERPCG